MFVARRNQRTLRPTMSGRSRTENGDAAVAPSKCLASWFSHRLDRPKYSKKSSQPATKASGFKVLIKLFEKAEKYEIDGHLVGFGHGRYSTFVVGRAQGDL